MEDQIAAQMEAQILTLYTKKVCLRQLGFVWKRQDVVFISAICIRLVPTCCSVSVGLSVNYAQL
jgi:hypothetical protein